MALIQNMPAITIAQAQLNNFGVTWQVSQSLSRTPPNSSSELGALFDASVYNTPLKSDQWVS